MKKILLILPFIAFGFTLSAQVVSSCQTTFIDTLKYVDEVKTSNWSAIPINVINDGGAYGYAGYGQRFEAPDSVKVLGFSFRGYVYSGSADTVICRLYEADGSGMPGVQIDSVIYTVPLVAGFLSPLDDDTIKNTVMFGSGHVIEGDYIFTVENFSTSDMYMVRNNAGDGAGEDLCLTYYKGVTDNTWDGWYQAFSAFGAAWNFDMPFEPIVEYIIESELTISSDSICGSDTLMVFDTIISFDDSVLYNKMYNPNFATYTGYNTSVNYNYGDGTSGDTTMHAYLEGGNFVVSASDTVFASGWTHSSFVATCNDVVYVNSASLGMDTTICMQSTMVLSPGDFDTYMWNTGQMTDSITVGPILNPGVITYTVDVTSASCNSTASVTVTFDNCTSIDEVADYQINAYPNPANDNFTFNTDFIGEYDLKMYDNQGKLVMNQRLSGTSQNVDVSGLDQGVYIIAISNENKVARKKLQILR